MLLVRYPSRVAFSRMVTDPEYQQVTHLRTKALTEAVRQPTTASWHRATGPSPITSLSAVIMGSCWPARRIRPCHAQQPRDQLEGGRQAGSRPVRPSSRCSGGASSGTGTGGPNSPGCGGPAAACATNSVHAATDAGSAA